MAIDFDAASAEQTTTGTSLSYSFTVGSGSNRLLLVGVTIESVSQTVSGVTYNGVAMTEEINVQNSTNSTTYLFSLENPTSGSNTVAISVSGSVVIWSAAASYIGILAAGEDVTGSATSASAGNASIGLTSTIDGDWMMGCAHTKTGSIAAATGCILRTTSATHIGMFDKHSSLTPAGLYSMTVSGSAVKTWVAIDWAPDSFTPPTYNNMALISD